MGSAQTALAVFEEIARRQPVSQAAVAFRTGFPVPTVHRAIQALSEAGWIRPVDGPPHNPRGRPAGPTGRPWVVSTRIGALIGSPNSHLVAVARPVLENLCDNVRESVSLSVLDGRDVVIIDHVESAAPLRVVNAIGYRVPAHTAAVGKALLALLPPPERDRFVRGGLRTYTESTITDPDDLLAELDAVRTAGYATMRGEFHESISSVGAAVVGSRLEPLAGVGVSGPSDHFAYPIAYEDMGEMVRRAAREISERLAGSERPVVA